MSRLRLLPILLFALVQPVRAQGGRPAGPGRRGGRRARAGLCRERAAAGHGSAQRAGRPDRVGHQEGRGGRRRPRQRLRPRPRRRRQPRRRHAKPVETAAPLIPLGASSPSERAILERLQQRREQLDQQGRELDMRENLLKAAEKRIEERIAELKQLEASVGGAQQRQDDADEGRMKSLVTMYEAMKPKDAARIFDRLDMTILVDVAHAMKPPEAGRRAGRDGPGCGTTPHRGAGEPLQPQAGRHRASSRRSTCPRSRASLRRAEPFCRRRRSSSRLVRLSVVLPFFVNRPLTRRPYGRCVAAVPVRQGDRCQKVPQPGQEAAAVSEPAEISLRTVLARCAGSAKRAGLVAFAALVVGLAAAAPIAPAVAAACCRQGPG